MHCAQKKMKLALLLIPVLRFLGMGVLAWGASRLDTRLSQQERKDAAEIPVNTLLYWIANVFPFDILVKDAGDLTLDAEWTISTDLGIETTENAGSECANLTIVFARGTSEVGNIGLVVGPELFDAVAERLGSDSTLAVQGVNYQASIPGFLQGGDPAGGEQMRGTHLLQRAHTQH